MAYSNLLKLNPIGKEIAPAIAVDSSSIGGREGQKNFDQWTEELARDAFARTDEEDGKVLSKTDDLFVEGDVDEAQLRDL